MTQEEFNEKIEQWGNRYNDPNERILAKGTIGFVLRMAITYPEFAKAYYDSVPKATMD